MTGIQPQICRKCQNLGDSLKQGWAISHFEKAAFRRGPYLLMEVEARIGL